MAKNILRFQEKCFKRINVIKVQQTCCSVLANLYHSRALSKSQCQCTSSQCHKLWQAAAATGQHDSAKVNWLYKWWPLRELRKFWITTWPCKLNQFTLQQDNHQLSQLSWNISLFGSLACVSQCICSPFSPSSHRRQDTCCVSSRFSLFGVSTGRSLRLRL